MLRALRSFLFRIFSSIVTAPGIVVVDVPSALSGLSYWLEEFSFPLNLPERIVLEVEWNEHRNGSSLASSKSRFQNTRSDTTC
ncbi:hypothetical protein Tco_0256703 [Tanacetum coccineum]